MTDGAGGMQDRWFDDAAGPVVRPYAMTRGRTHSGTGHHRLDLIAQVVAEEVEPDPERESEPEGNAADGQEARDAREAPSDDDSFERALHADRTLGPEHIDIVLLCRAAPQSVADLAAELDLPVGVVRVLIGDLVDAEWVRVTRPVPPAELPDESILREVIDGLRAL
ncbi:DUF742 domain-containing protein [Streptomyces sp. ODS28]|uniref:DUF742 domain-containing protein n=1 Tax=Streptomyces sp. ODS28 TaxID=3136688 RepID=UPI0031F1177C